MEGKRKFQFLSFLKKNSIKIKPLEPSNRDTSESEKEVDLYSSDLPITNPKYDLFGRYEFSKRIANIIISRKNNQCLVISINGKWGEGKTTVLNFILNELEKKGEIITISFNPWNFSDENELLISFYELLANKLETKLYSRKEELVESFKKYLTPVGALFDRKEFVEGVSQWFSKINLELLRDRISKILIEENKKLVIFLDDIDRLDKKELYTLFKLIKLSANLKNLVYILAFDDDVVADALQERYGSNNINAGRNFLEKIIQIPINLPKIERLKLRENCLINIQNVLNENKINLNENQVQEFLHYFENNIFPIIDTPRMIIRYSNVIAFSMPLLKSEVNIIDLLLIEAIRTFYPNAYDIISSNKDIFIGNGLISPVNENTAKKLHRDIVEKCFPTSEGNQENSRVQTLILKLFPRMESLYRNINYPYSFDSKWAREKRICSSRYFEKYFLYSTQTNEISDQKIDFLFSSIGELSQDQLSSNISSLLDSNNIDSFLFKIKLGVDGLSPEDAKKFAFSILLLADGLANKDMGIIFTSAYSQIGSIIAKLINLQPSEEAKLATINKIILETNNTSLISAILSMFNYYQKNEPDQNIISEEKMKDLYKKLAEKIDLEIINRPTIFENNPLDAPRLILILSKYLSRDKVNNYINLYVSEDPENIINILKCYLPKPLGSINVNDALESDFDGSIYDSMLASFDLDILYLKLKETYGDTLITDEYPQFLENNKLKIYSQFMWVHNKRISPSK